jgi:polygalacturonase
VRISGCSVNSPWDDGICLKSSFALGEARATENVTISNCYVTGGFALGTMLDGTFRRIDANAGQPTGRIKCGTESNGGFKNITVKDCMFESCRGFALETVDGGPIEDITVTGVTMRDIRNAPFFLRLGARLRAPAGTSAGTLRRVIINEVICDAPANHMPAIIAGIPGHPIEDIGVSDVSMAQKGGASAAIAEISPPEQEREYPEPSFFGPLPAQGLLVRHARNVAFRDVAIASTQADARPFVWLGDVTGADFSGLNLSPLAGVPALRLHETRSLRVSASRGLPDVALDRVADGRLP